MSGAEVQLVSRCREALRQCRSDLEDLRAVCNAATSHKAACAQLLEAGTSAVDALDQLVTASGSDLERCRDAQKMAARVQSALDQAEALAKTYGRKLLLNRFASEVLSLMTNQVPLKFDSAITELTNLAQKMRHDALHPPLSDASAHGVWRSGASESGLQGGRSPGGVVRGSLPASLTSGSAGMDSRGQSTAYGSLGSTIMGSTVFGSPNSGTLVGSRSASGVVGVRTSGAAGLETGAVCGTGRVASPGSNAQQQRRQMGGQQQAEAEAASQEAEEAEPVINSWVIGWDELERVRVLSKLKDGQVWLGRWHETDVAIRELGSLEVPSLSPEQQQRDESDATERNRAVLQALNREVGPLKNVRHPNVILFMGVAFDPPAIVTEYCSRGSLRGLLQQARSNAAMAVALSWPRRLMMALDAAKGMMYLHSKWQPAAHAALSTGNLLVEKSWRIKVANFGLSRDAAEAPASKAEDVFAFGLVLLELLTWQPAGAQQGQRPVVPSEAEAAQLPGGSFPAFGDYAALIQRCWAEQPEERPSFEQIVAEVRQILEKVQPPRGGANTDDQH